MKTVFLFIHHHSHIADLINTNYIKYLSEKYKVVVFLPKRKGKEALGSADYLRNKNIIYIEQQLEQVRWWYRFKLLRASCVRQFDFLLSSKVNYKRTTQKDRRKVFLRRLSLMLPIWVFSTRSLTFLEKNILPDEEFFINAVEKYKPSIVMTASPGFTFFEAWAILLAKKHNIPTCAINFTWDNLTSNGKLIRKTDYLIAWNDIIKKEALKYHRYSADSVFVSGSLRFDHYFKKMDGELNRDDFLKSKNLDPRRKTVFVATMSDNNYPHHVELIDTILNFRDSLGDKEAFNILVRVHPIDNFNRYEKFTTGNISNFHIERAGESVKDDTSLGQKIQMNKDDMLNLKHTLAYTDVCINPFSTVSLEAMIFNKPVINIGLDPQYRPALEYIHYKPLLDKGAVRVAYTEAQLQEYIDFYLNNPKADSENRKKIVREFIEFTDGCSYERSVDFLEKIIKS